MADRPKKKQQSGVRNDARKNGKAPKKNPKLTPPKSRTDEEILAQQQKHAAKRSKLRHEVLLAEEARERAAAERAARQARLREADAKRKAAQEVTRKLTESLRRAAG